MFSLDDGPHYTALDTPVVRATRPSRGTQWKVAIIDEFQTRANKKAVAPTLCKALGQIIYVTS